jgi:hypothetical protein
MTTFGDPGSTLVDELNRLAEIIDLREYQDEQGAAATWLGTSGPAILGSLNKLADPARLPSEYKGLNAICNELAGTTGLEAIPALREIPTKADAPELLTSEAVYYVDSTAPQNWGSLGYVELNGATPSRLFVNDSSDFDITGDIDVRWYGSFSDWSATSGQTLYSRQTGADNRHSSLVMSTTNAGRPVFSWYSLGTTASGISAACTAAVPFTANEAGWVRVTLDVDNGAGTPQYEVIFYTSTDGTNWTQLGTTITGSTGVTSLPNVTSQLDIGAQFATLNPMTGRFNRFQMFNGIAGTKVLDIDIANDWKATDSTTNFYATTGQLVTVNGTPAAVRNLGTAGSLLPTTVGSSTAIDSNDPRFLDHTGTNYVYLPGVDGNRLSVPDAAALDITGDIDIRAYVALDDWTPAAFSNLISKRDSGQISYSLGVNTNGVLNFAYTTDGTTSIANNSSVAPTITDGASLWVRATLDVDNGASGNDIKFFTSTDGTNWTQLGTTITTAGVTSIFSGTATVAIGARSSGTQFPLAGKVFRAQILDGIDGTTVLDVDTSVITAGNATSFTAVTGQTVTINRSTSGRKSVAVVEPVWLFGTDDYMEVNNRYLAHTGTNYLYLPGVSLNAATTPDAAAVDITGDIDIRCKVALDDWTPAALGALVSKSGAAGNRSYQLSINTNGTINFSWYEDGTNILTSNSTVAPTIADGETLWVRVTLDVDNGNSENETKFFTSTDGTNWTQLGTTVTKAGTTSIYNSNTQFAVGANSQTSLTQTLRGKFFRAQVLDGIGGTVAFDANFETSITDLLQTTFTESSTNAATVTINRSGSTYRSAGITQAGYLYPGATNTFSASATDFLNFGANESFSIILVNRQPSITASQVMIANKVGAGATLPGYVLRNATSGTATGALVSDGTTAITANGTNRTAGELNTLAVVYDTSSNLLKVVTDGTSGTAVSGLSTNSLRNFEQLRIGRFSGSGTNYADMELYAAAVFRKALTPLEVKAITDYYADRVGA